MLHAGIDHVRLSSLVELGVDEIDDLGPAVRCARVGANASATGGDFVDRRDVQVAVQRQPKGAGDGGGGHHQEVGVVALAEQFITLFHAEFMLLVDYHEANVL